MSVGPTHFIVVSLLLFCIGGFGVLIRRNILIMLMCIEMMLTAANLALVTFSRYNGTLDGQVVVLFSFVIAACEVAVGLSIVIAAFRLKPSVDVGQWRQLRG